MQSPLRVNLPKLGLGQVVGGSAGHTHTLLWTSAGVLLGSGSNKYGQLGVLAPRLTVFEPITFPSSSSTSSSTPDLRSFISSSSSSSSSDNHNNGGSGAIGAGTRARSPDTTITPTPTTIAEGRNNESIDRTHPCIADSFAVVSAACGQYHSIVLRRSKNNDLSHVAINNNENNSHSHNDNSLTGVVADGSELSPGTSPGQGLATASGQGLATASGQGLATASGQGLAEPALFTHTSTPPTPTTPTSPEGVNTDGGVTRVYAFGNNNFGQIDGGVCAASLFRYPFDISEGLVGGGVHTVLYVTAGGDQSFAVGLPSPALGPINPLILHSPAIVLFLCLFHPILTLPYPTLPYAHTILLSSSL